MSDGFEAIKKILDDARRSERSVLLETEGRALLGELGIRVPPHIFVQSPDQLTQTLLRPIAGERVVVKVVSHDVLHKSDVHGIEVVANDCDLIARTMRDMARRLVQIHIDGYSVEAFVPHSSTFGHELLLGARWTEDFGPVMVFGAGGTHSEFLADNLKSDRDVAIFSGETESRHDIIDAIRGSAAGVAALSPLRGQAAAIDADAVAECVQRLQSLSGAFMPHDIRELEINPLAVGPDGLVALDILVRLGDGSRPAAAARPLHKLKNLLEPGSVAVLGVSSRMNPGRVILRNLIRDGFAKDNIYVVKPGSDDVDGCRCYPSIAALPVCVDLAVISIDASQSARALTEIVEQRKAQSVILIPGGFDEKAGTEDLVRDMHAAIDASRKSDWQGPLINGGNSLGIQSGPGGYDTLFIPEHKLGVETQDESPLAFVSQSGAFAISKNSKLRFMKPRYTITVGNQFDVTIGDYLTHLKDDPAIDVFAVYTEGFRPLDGRRFIDAARDITSSGRTVVLYRAGRTGAGARAAASHTASIAGDYRVTQALSTSAGVLVAETLSDFEDLLMLACTLRKKTFTGWRLGAVSNAGFECVAIADNAARFELPAFTDETSERIRALLEESRIDNVIDVHNPMDLTPMAGEKGYEAVVRTVLADVAVDVGVIGCVPLTPALNTLAPSEDHGEDVFAADSIASRIARIFHDHMKPFVAVVDAGAVYDPMATAMLREGLPVFRTADRALRLLNQLCHVRLRARRDR